VTPCSGVAGLYAGILLSWDAV